MSIVSRRVSAHIDGDFVVFLIGARINRWWNLPRHLWFGKTMPQMLAELAANPASGFLGYQQLSMLVNVQYWRTVEQLIAFARDPDQTHHPSWVRFNAKLAKSGDIGIWHETYCVRAGEYEAIYHHMPPWGLAKVASCVDAVGESETATGRLAASSGVAGRSASGTE